MVFWRLDLAPHAGSWDSGEGSFRVGGRWSSAGVRAVYAALDPATAILEVAVHKGFRVLDTVAHVLTSATVADPSRIHVVTAADLPNPNWLHPGIPSAGQQTFGDERLKLYPFMLIPSVVSTHSWNLVFSAAVARGSMTPTIRNPSPSTRACIRRPEHVNAGRTARMTDSLMARSAFEERLSPGARGVRIRSGRRGRPRRWRRGR